MDEVDARIQQEASPADRDTAHAGAAVSTGAASAAAAAAADPIHDAATLLEDPTAPPSTEERQEKEEARKERFGIASPPPERENLSEMPERKQKRRRSASPASRRDIDMYRPDYRGDGHLPRRARLHGPRDEFFRGGPPRSRVPAPEEVSYQVSFRHFADFHRDIQSPVADSKEALDSAYGRYRSDFTARQLALFFEENRTRAWFRERYDPSLAEFRKRVKLQGREGKVDKFLTSLANNVLTDLSYDLVAPSHEESSQTNGDVKMEGDALTTDRDSAANQYNGMSNANRQASIAAAIDERSNAKDDRTKAGEDELVLIAPAMNQLFVKAISPDIERLVLENHCAQVEGYSYIAMSEPNHMRRYQRVGWVCFRPGTNMDAALERLGESKVQLGNSEFTLHMQQNTNPTYQKARIGPGVLNERDRLEKDLAQAGQLVARLEREVGDTRGTASITAHFSALREAAQAAMTELPEESKTSIMSGIVCNSNQLFRDSLLTERKVKRELDAILFYLRNVFNTCYYCTCICDFPEELLARCAKHVRRPAGMPTPDVPKSQKNGDVRRQRRPNDQAFLRRLDERMALLIDPEAVDPREQGGKGIADELHRLCTPYVKAEDESKFRCQMEQCGKLFKALTFAEKHIANKHPDVVTAPLARVKFFNNYVLDPDRLLPPSPEPPQYSGIPYINMPNTGPMNGDLMHGPIRDRRSGRGGREPLPERPTQHKRMRRELREAQDRLVESLPPPAPPKGQSLDPRAARAQRTTYEDLDNVASVGDLELEY